MAFIGLLLVMGVAFVVLMCMGVFPIIIGTHLIHHTDKRKLGTFLRILGYILLVPIIAIIVFFIIGMMIS